MLTIRIELGALVRWIALLPTGLSSIPPVQIPRWLCVTISNTHYFNLYDYEKSQI